MHNVRVFEKLLKPFITKGFHSVTKLLKPLVDSKKI